MSDTRPQELGDLQGDLFGECSRVFPQRQARVTRGVRRRKHTIWVQELRRFVKSGLYRHFNCDGELLYVGETEDFLARTISHLRESPWRDEIYTIELEPMSKDSAKQIEPQIIRTELPKYNTSYHPLNAAKARERQAQESARVRALVDQRIAEYEQREAAARAARQQELREAAQRSVARMERQKPRLEKWRADENKRRMVLAMRKRAAPWDGRLETYQSIYDYDPLRPILTEQLGGNT